MKKIILITALAILPTNILFSADKKADESWKNKKFTAEELKKYNGENGMPVYVAADGIVYDVSKSKYWKTGKHMKMHEAGNDLSEDLKKRAPQKIHKGGKILQKMPKVGVLAGSPLPAGKETLDGKKTGSGPTEMIEMVETVVYSPKKAGEVTNPELKSEIIHKAEKALEPALKDETTKKIREVMESTGTVK